MSTRSSRPSPADDRVPAPDAGRAVRTIDAHVAEALVRLARAVRLLGAETVITGISPEVAQALVQIGVDLGDLVTLGDLRSGIAHAQARTGGA